MNKKVNTIQSSNIMKPKEVIAPYYKDILKLLSFNPSKTEILGSFALKSQLYTGDIDMFEVVSMPLVRIASLFQQKIKALLSNSSVYIGDIKLGVYNKLRIIDETAFYMNNKAYRYDYNQSIKRLEEVKPYLNANEYKQARSLLKKNPNEAQLGQIIKNLRFHIIRWKPKDILKGYVLLRDKHKYTLLEGLKSPTLFKVDITHYHLGVFTEITIIYDLRNIKGLKSNAMRYNVRGSLLNDIRIFLSKKEYFKVLKRRMSLLRYDYKYRNKKENRPKIVVLTRVLNSQLGQLYQVKVMLDNLIYLMDSFNNLDKQRVRANVSLMIGRLSNIYLGDYLRKEKQVVGNLLMVLRGKSVGKIEDHLIESHNTITKVLNDTAKRFI